MLKYRYNKYSEVVIMLSFEMVVERVNALNSLCESKNLASRFKLIGGNEHAESGQYSLLLGSEEQFRYGTHQMELLRTDDLSMVKYDLDTLSCFVEFEALHGNI